MGGHCKIEVELKNVLRYGQFFVVHDNKKIPGPTQQILAAEASRVGPLDHMEGDRFLAASWPTLGRSGLVLKPVRHFAQMEQSTIVVSTGGEGIVK